MGDYTNMSAYYDLIMTSGYYDYQKIEFAMEHNRNVGVFGRLRYGFNAGFVNGTVAYPFLKVHEGSQSYWLYTNSFNRMSFFEFISDRYVGALVEQHWQGLFFDRIPLVKKLKWRLVLQQLQVILILY